MIILIFSRKERYSGYKATSDTPSMDTALSIQKAMRNPDIKRVLRSVCTHLDEAQQIPIHKLTGVLEVVDTIQQLLDSSYRIQVLPSTISSDKVGKQLAIIKTLKDHAHEEDKNLLEAVESAIATAEKIKKVMQGINASEGFNKAIDISEPLPYENKHCDIDEVKESIEIVEADNSVEN
ncbi:MAG: hypothetical protein JJT76_09200 [Clostridiaceae bacterium]|nr:hypothetical protein [Clostridiaceae bacterium]